jgi:hypothetical protein
MPHELKKSLLPIILLMALSMGLFVILLSVGKKQDIRPKAAIAGSANLLLQNVDETLTNKPLYVEGNEFIVKAKMELTDVTMRASGADFILLYDKNKLKVLDVRPNVTTEDGDIATFTDAPIVTKEGYFDETYNFLRVAEVARLPDDQLRSVGTFKLATIMFRVISSGQAGPAIIKYPDDNKYLEFVGVNIP